MRYKSLAIMAIAPVVGLVLLFVADQLLSDPNREHAFFVILLGSFLAARVIASRWETQQRERPLRELAQRTGLIYHSSNMWLGSEAYVTGTYRGYTLCIYNRLVQTRLELTLRQHIGIDLRMRGPYRLGTIEFDKVAGHMFGARSTYQIGDQQFLIKSEPARLATDLVAPVGLQQGSLRGRLPVIRHRVDVKVDGYKIIFDHGGILEDAAYVLTLLDLMCDMAQVIEQAAETMSPRKFLNP